MGERRPSEEERAITVVTSSQGSERRARHATIRRGRHRTDEHNEDFTRGFNALGELALAGVQVSARATDLATGRELFELLKCQQCHVLGTIPRDQEVSNLAPDLRMATDRLQADWILDWLRAPATIVPGTRMPAFWPEYPKSYYPHFGGSGEAQIRAVRDHLLTLRGGPSPRTPAGTQSAND